ncbi:MAG: hypothetical protein F6K36_04115 [Symploca sp. SIO3C6]|uniref:Uncharacterized protein n=1 Tax=Symploca sp. SIO1C4 TaxID=2607765 RepID=A0A6B3N6N9_9CYAN|nr:hypothetical protein [Symploca sp. SIO3C6]NER26465.1 hypothetical protein [Symploca sp. SIO1C4]
MLFLESILVGWLLSEYKAHWLIGIGTQAVSFYLAWVGTDAIALAVAWVVAVVWGGTLSHSIPRIVQEANITVWAGALALSWLLGLVFIVTLAFAKRVTESVNRRQTEAFWMRLLITWVGFSVGWIVDSIFMLGLID